VGRGAITLLCIWLLVFCLGAGGELVTTGKEGDMEDGIGFAVLLGLVAAYSAELRHR